MIVSALLVIVVSILVSAFFSGMEIAFLSSNRLKLEIEKKQNRTFAFIANLLESHPGQYITTILVGNNISLVIYSLQMTFLLSHLLQLEGTLSLLLETLISTVVIIFTGEFIPKTAVRLNPNFYYRAFAVPAYLFYLLFYPISKVVTALSALILRITGLPLNRDQVIKTFDRTDLAHLLDEASENESKGENEKDIKLFQNALDFSHLKVRDCMVPRIYIEAVEKHRTIAEVSERFIATSFSRLLVYEDNIDRVIGYVTTKSLFQQPTSIDQIIKEVDYVPESMQAQQLLTTFIKKHRAVAVVIDEFGGTAGMITIEDILEEIFGEIEDEHDTQELLEKQVSATEFIFSGGLEVDYLNDKYNLDIPESEHYETLAGYFISLYHGIPQVGETIHHHHKQIKVLRMSSSKIELLRLTLDPPKA